MSLLSSKNGIDLVTFEFDSNDPIASAKILLILNNRYAKIAPDIKVIDANSFDVTYHILIGRSLLSGEEFFLRVQLFYEKDNVGNVIFKKMNYLLDGMPYIASFHCKMETPEKWLKENAEFILADSMQQIDAAKDEILMALSFNDMFYQNFKRVYIDD